MNWKLFEICAALYAGTLVSYEIGYPTIAKAFFWAAFIAIVLNFFVTAKFVVKKNKELFGKQNDSEDKT